LNKTKAAQIQRADPEADIALINQYSRKELTPEEVYCFTVRLCDNEVDRDGERFTEQTLKELAPLFQGKPCLMDHRWSAEKQIARIYRTETVETREKNSLGGPLTALMGSAYMVRNEQNAALIDAIEGGILKEVSVSCAVQSCTCSICGEAQKFDWRSGEFLCKNGHIQGERYDGRLCCGNLEGAKDAYEVSFVAVPAQRRAGVTKGAANLDEAFQILQGADLTGYETQIQALRLKLQTALSDAAERAARERIIAENKQYLQQKG